METAISREHHRPAQAWRERAEDCGHQRMDQPHRRRPPAAHRQTNSRAGAGPAWSGWWRRQSGAAGVWIARTGEDPLNLGVSMKSLCCCFAIAAVIACHSAASGQVEDAPDAAVKNIPVNYTESKVG